MRIARILLLALLLFTSAQLAQAAAWQRVLPPLIGDGLQVYDPVRDEILFLPLGSATPPAEYWVMELRPPGRWRRAVSTGGGPDFAHARAAVYDRFYDRVLVIARNARDPLTGPGTLTVWSFALDGSARWIELRPGAVEPPDRHDFAFAGLPGLPAFFLFGGADEEFGSPAWNDGWYLILGQDVLHWSNRMPSTGPTPARSGGAMAYDPEHKRYLLVGGDQALPGGGSISPSNELWTFDINAQPPTRKTFSIPDEFIPFAAHPQAIYDGPSHRLVVIARPGPPTAVDLGDLNSWSSIEAPEDSIPGAWISGTSLDGSQGVVLAGDSDARAFSLTPFAGYRRVGPLPDRISSPWRVLYDCPSFADGRDGSVLTWGGFVGSEPGAERTMWRFSLDQDPHWQSIPVPGDAPAARIGAAVAYDGRRNRWLVYGGIRAHTDTTTDRLDDLWAFDPIAWKWTRLGDTGHSGPGALVAASATYDGLRDRFIVFGGTVLPHATSDRTWAWSLGAPTGWVELGASGRRPRPRANAVTVWDPLRDRILISGGWRLRHDGGLGDIPGAPLVDSWVLPMEPSAVWDSIATSPLEPNITSPSVSWFDVARDEVEAVGLIPRIAADGTTRTTVRRFAVGDISRWEVAPGIDGYAESPGAPVFDAGSYRIYMFQGRDLRAGWMLDRGQPMHQVYLEPGQGNPGRGHGPVTFAVLGDPLFDAADLDPASATLGGVAALPEKRSDQAALRDINGDGRLDRLVRFDQDRIATPSGDAKTVRFEARTNAGQALVGFLRPDASARTPFVLAGDPDGPTNSPAEFLIERAGPIRGRLEIHFELPGHGSVAFEIFGVNGRRLIRESLTDLDAGPHVWAPSAGGNLPAGVYFARGTFGPSTAVGKFVVLPH